MMKIPVANSFLIIVTDISNSRAKRGIILSGVKVKKQCHTVSGKANGNVSITGVLVSKQSSNST